ncbi:MAG: hypothetical protein OHK0046_43050 [Anaerolineae bacterium]
MTKVLAVDDNGDNLELISDIVSALGYEVIKAFDGPQALDAVQSSIPDLIILDVNMPGMSGFEVVARLKQDTTTAKIPVILLTALMDIDNKVEGLELGADDYLTKPYSPRELIARIETRLRAKSETDNLRETQQMIRATFERFVSPIVVEQLLKNPGQVKLGGKLQEITVFFADMENFTSISEHADPEELLSVLNSYHALVVEMVQENKGTVDKFIGDAVMALYNTPLELPDHPLRAVRTAYQIQQALSEFRLQFKPMYRMNINFGIHTGMAVVGNVGAPHIMDYTAVGDTVNVASRLQGLSDGGQILISEATYRAVKPYTHVNPLGAKAFKGRSELVETYEVLEFAE